MLIICMHGSQRHTAECVCYPGSPTLPRPCCFQLFDRITPTVSTRCPLRHRAKWSHRSLTGKKRIIGNVVLLNTSQLRPRFCRTYVLHMRL